MLSLEPEIIMNNNVICPICGNNNLLELFTTNSLSVINHLLISENKKVVELYGKKIETLWPNKNAAFYSCTDCSFEFASPFTPADAEFYSLIYNSDSNYPVEKWEYTISQESICNYIKYSEIQPRLIEIGAGNGSFLKKIIDIVIPAKEVFATEFSEAGAKSIETFSIKCFRKDFNLISEQDIHGKVNIVCLFQVLEHITAIHEFFKKVNELTLPESRVYISVPNIFHRRFFDRFGLHYDLPPIHVGRYNYKSLSRLAEQYGWRIINHAIQPTTFKERILKFIFSQYSQWLLVFNAEKVKVKLIRVILRYIMIAILSIIYIKVIVGLRKSNLGTAQWFELERINLS
jgi:hypothetical protein